MRTHVVLAVAMTAGIALHGADLFDENSALKAELKNQIAIMQPLHQKNQDTARQIETLKITNDLVSGKTDKPPEEIQQAETVIWNYKLNSRHEYYGNNKYPEFAKNVRDKDVEVLRIAGEEEKNHCLVKYFSKEDVEKIKGRKITCTIMVKGENIEGKGAVKFMLMVGLPDKKTDWPDAQIGRGSFDWRSVSFSYNVPIDAKSIAMIIGLQGPVGTVYYKNIKVTVAE